MINTLAKDIDFYNDAEELLAESDLVEMECHVVGWQKKFFIRALTLGKMSKINQMATDEKTGRMNEDDYVFWTIVEGVIRPKFTIDQARKLSDKNGEFLRELCDKIWSIGKLNKKIFDAVMQEQKELLEAEEKELEEIKKEQTKNATGKKY